MPRACSRCRAVVVTAGTFLQRPDAPGRADLAGGRSASRRPRPERSLCGWACELGRLKTGTCPRLAAETIDYGRCTRQDGDAAAQPFSFLNDRLDVEQVPCWITHTNAEVHELIRANLHRAPMYSGQIQSTGPRYCPSIETKIVRFADKDSHQMFLEPEGRDDQLGLLQRHLAPRCRADVQDAMVHG